MFNRRQVMLAMLASAGGGACSSSAFANVESDDYPTRAITLIVPFAPGGSTDFIARLVAEHMARGLGQPIVVFNQGGGSTMIGTERSIRAAPDGYTLLLGSTTLAINPGLRKRMPYDTLKDLQPVSMLSRVPYVLVVNPKAGVKTVEELIARAKLEPDKVTVGSPGVGSGGHLAAALFEMLAGVRFTHVPYKGTAPATMDVLGGQIDALFGTMLSVMPHIESGALLPLAVSINKRVAALPNVPTIAEAGLPNYEASSWNGILVTSGTPRPIIDRLNREIRLALDAEAVHSALAKDGGLPDPGTPEEFRSFLEAEIAKWTAVIKADDIKPE